VRVFRWTQSDGEDRLTPAAEVVASPPAATLAPGAAQLVRVVRVQPGPARTEESYRVLVDIIPDAATRRPGEVTMVVRQSLPVFFDDGPALRAELGWSVENGPGGALLVARNRGGRRARISEIELRDAAGAIVTRIPGLAGYVLAGAARRWPLPSPAAARAVSLSANTDLGPIRADLSAAPAH
jgi:fimbrial chaperone protein